MKRQPKLTEKQYEQLMWCMDYIERKGCYYGKKDNFKKRHEKIKGWLEANLPEKEHR